jgi:hypothetical protein
MLKKTVLTAFVVLALTALPIFALAADDVATGTISGLSCYTTATMCPSDENDPHVALEHTFVLGIDKTKYFLLTNVGRQTLAPMVTQKVRVTGNINDKFKSMYAYKIEVQDGDKWELAWSEDLERKAREEMMMGSH